ncbi:MAG: ABC transporter substrate-binding protein [Gaiellaceae bacterium]
MRRATISLLVLAAAAAAGAGARAASDPGVTASTILIGGTAPLTGAASDAARARGAAAYLRWVNARGGIDGRRVVYRVVDDRGSPLGTVRAVERLVERDRVFALFNLPGTAANLAVRAFLNERKVPQLFVGSGHSAWGSQSRRYPYTVGYGPSHFAEGAVYGRRLARTSPGARIAVLYRDDEDGQDLLNGLRRGLGRSAGRIVEAVGHDPAATSVGREVAELRAAGADALVVLASGRLAGQAVSRARRLGWRPQVYVDATSAGAAARAGAAGAISAAYVKDPADPSWSGDPGLELYEQVMARYLPGANARDAGYVAGMAAAFTLVTTLDLAGGNLTRQSVLKATANLRQANNPFLLPGIVVRAGPNDRFPIEQLQLRRWNGARWVRFGGLIAAE